MNQLKNIWKRPHKEWVNALNSLTPLINENLNKNISADRSLMNMNRQSTQEKKMLNLINRK